MFGDEGRRWLRGREGEVFPRWVRSAAVRALWIGLLVTLTGLVIVAVLVGRIV